MSDKSEELKIEELKRKYNVGSCKIPERIESFPALKLPNHKFVAPRTIDLRDYCTPTNSQGNKPWCAAYSACQYVENILWRRDDYPTEIDPEPVYRHAKTVDGDPNGDGTTLNAALDYFIKNEYFVKDAEIQFIYGNDAEEKVKYGVHKFGCVHAAFDCDSSWFTLNKNKTSLTLNGLGDSVGGHAVLICSILPYGVIIQNSWDEDWGAFGFALIPWDVFRKEFLYGCVISHSLDGFKMN